MPRKKKTEEPVEVAVVEEAADHGDRAEIVVLPAEARPAELSVTAGSFALAAMSDEEFEAQLAAMMKGRERIARIQRELMTEDVDFGVIPGTEKPTLFKSGAEKLALAYGLAARVETQFFAGNGDTEPPLRYEAQTFLHLRSFDGPIVAQGHGSANSWEKRYRRAGGRTCPECGKPAIIKSKFKPGWYCFPKNGGCGKNFSQNDPRLQAAEAPTNPKGEPVEQYDLGVTLLKMAEKRSFVDAVLRATASSGLFTQDMAEEPADEVEYREQKVTENGNVVDASTGEVLDLTGNPDEDHAAADQSQPEPEIRPNHVEGVGRGGKTEGASDVQTAQVKAYSKGLKLGPHGLVNTAAALLQEKDIEALDPPVLPDSVQEAVPVVTSWLEHLPAPAIGALLQKLRQMDEARR